MLIRKLTVASLLSLTLLSLPALTANAAEPSFVYCKEISQGYVPALLRAAVKYLDVSNNMRTK